MSAIDGLGHILSRDAGQSIKTHILESKKGCESGTYPRRTDVTLWIVFTLLFILGVLKWRCQSVIFAPVPGGFAISGSLKEPYGALKRSLNIRKIVHNEWNRVYCLGFFFIRFQLPPESSS